jgi:hypothetical protein
MKKGKRKKTKRKKQEVLPKKNKIRSTNHRST